MNQNLKELSRESLEQIIMKIADLLSPEQYWQFVDILADFQKKETGSQTTQTSIRMSREYVNEKMEQIRYFMSRVDEGELYLNTDSYEDYSAGYWDSEWITDYYDNQGIGNQLLSAVQFAKDCVDDRRYQEASEIYDWLWSMYVCAEAEEDPLDLEMLVEQEIVRTDIRQLALLTLYANYQVTEAGERAQDIYRYFSMYPFMQIHIEEMFCVGRENLTETEQFWKDWIALLKTKNGETEARLLQEAVLH